MNGTTIKQLSLIEKVISFLRDTDLPEILNIMILITTAEMERVQPATLHLITFYATVCSKKQLIIKIGSSFSGHRLANPNRIVKSIKSTLYEKNQISKFKFYTS